MTRSMKSIYFLTLAVLICGFKSPLNAQNSPIFAQIEQAKREGHRFEVTPLFTKSHTAQPELDKAVSGYELLELCSDRLRKLYEDRPLCISVPLQYEGQTLSVEMQRYDLATDDFSVVTQQDPTAPQPLEMGVFYRGIVGEESQSIASFTVFADEIMGMVSTGRLGNLNIGHVEQAPKDRYILFSENKIADTPEFDCQTAEPDKYSQKVAEYLESNQGLEYGGCVRVFLECENELVVNKGSVQGAVNYLTGVFNNVATLYANESIQVRLSQILVWTVPDAYPSTSGAAIDKFDSDRQYYNGDVAFLAALSTGSLGGIAWVDALCDHPYSYAYGQLATSFQNVPVYSWTVEVMTHEIGHVLGSPHTHSCSWPGGALDNCATPEGGCVPGPAPLTGGTIMSYCHISGYGINFSKGFGAKPGDLIRNRVQNAPCLLACAGISSCTPPAAIVASNVTDTSVKLGWVSSPGATSFMIQYRKLGTSAWTSVPAPSTPLTLNGLAANQLYEVQIASNCSGAISNYSSIIVFKTTNTGGGIGSCNAPGSINFTGVSQVQATATWPTVAGALKYRVYWKINAATTWFGPFDVTSNSFLLSGLLASNTYNVKVATVCSSGISTAIQANITTPANPVCAEPLNLTVSGITSNSGKINWTAMAFAQQYNLQWRKSGATTWNTITNITQNAYTLSGLQPNTTYYVKIRTVCIGSNNASGYTLVKSFKTAVGSSPLLGGDSTPENPIDSTDADGLKEFEVDAATIDVMGISPNPASDYFLLNMQLEEEHAVTAELFTTYFKSLALQKETVKQGSFLFETSGLTSGIYFLQVTAPGMEPKTFRIVVQ